MEGTNILKVIIYPEMGKNAIQVVKNLFSKKNIQRKESEEEAFMLAKQIARNRVQEKLQEEYGVIAKHKKYGFIAILNDLYSDKELETMGMNLRLIPKKETKINRFNS